MQLVASGEVDERIKNFKKTEKQADTWVSMAQNGMTIRVRVAAYLYVLLDGSTFVGYGKPLTNQGEKRREQRRREKTEEDARNKRTLAASGGGSLDRLDTFNDFIGNQAQTDTLEKIIRNEFEIFSPSEVQSAKEELKAVLLALRRQQAGGPDAKRARGSFDTSVSSVASGVTYSTPLGLAPQAVESSSGGAQSSAETGTQGREVL